MDLTIYDLKNIKKNCENLTTVIDNLLKTKYQNNSDKPFNSLTDYENSIQSSITLCQTSLVFSKSVLIT